jgi:hypothetical protein
MALNVTPGASIPTGSVTASTISFTAPNTVSFHQETSYALQVLPQTTELTRWLPQLRGQSL